MPTDSIKQKTISGALWKFCERVLGQLMSFIVSIILARLLLPDDYGLIALVFVFTTLCDKLLICGFATSLIQKKDSDDIDFSSVLIFSLVAALVLYALLFLSAPLIADFYSNFDRELLISVLRVTGVGLFVMAFSSVQHAYVSKQMLFRRNFWSALGGTVISGIVGILMAYRGYGVWSLVAQNLLATIFDCIILLFIVKWHPRLTFSFQRLRVLFSFGWKIFVSSIIKMLYNDLRSLIIGKVYTPTQLAFYNRGQSLPQLLDSNVTGTIDSVLFPAYSKLQDDNLALMRAMRRVVKSSCYALMPLLAIMAALAEPIVRVLLTDKWLPCVPFMQILCLSFMFSPVETENLQSIKALGRSDIVLKLEVAKRTIGVILLISSVPFGLEAIAWSMCIGNIIAALLNASPNKKLLGYSFLSQVIDILPSILMSAVVFIAAWGCVKLLPNSNPWIQLLLGSSIGLLFYLVSSIVFKVDSFLYIVSVLCNRFKKNGE